MNPELAVLRIVHILGGMIWVGTSLFMGSFLMPALATVGPTGGAVIGALKNRRLFTIIPAIALLTMLAGLRLMMIVVALLGMVPAARASGIGSDVQRPLATVVVGGLLSTLFLTLLALPSMYYLVERRRERRS